MSNFQVFLVHFAICHCGQDSFPFLPKTEDNRFPQKSQWLPTGQTAADCTLPPPPQSFCPAVSNRPLCCIYTAVSRPARRRHPACMIPNLLQSWILLFHGFLLSTSVLQDKDFLQRWKKEQLIFWSVLSEFWQILEHWIKSRDMWCMKACKVCGKVSFWLLMRVQKSGKECNWCSEWNRENETSLDTFSLNACTKRSDFWGKILKLIHS